MIVPAARKARPRPGSAASLLSRKLHELIERELVVVNCLTSSICAIRLGLHALQDDPKTLAEPPATWLGRAETSLLFARAELAYLYGPAPPPALRRIA